MGLSLFDVNKYILLNWRAKHSALVKTNNNLNYYSVVFVKTLLYVRTALSSIG